MTWIGNEGVISETLTVGDTYRVDLLTDGRYEAQLRALNGTTVLHCGEAIEVIERVQAEAGCSASDRVAVVAAIEDHVGGEG